MKQNNQSRPRSQAQSDVHTFLTVPEVARRWRVTADHLYRDVLGKELPAFRVGSHPRSPWRIALSDVEQYEATHRVRYSSFPSVSRPSQDDAA